MATTNIRWSKIGKDREEIKLIESEIDVEEDQKVEEQIFSENSLLP